jgi:hypothetical protein
MSRSKTSQYHGVCLDKNKYKWKAQIYFKGVNKHLGNFCDEKAAALAYDKAAFDCGKLKCLNFPELATETETVDRGTETKNDAMRVCDPQRESATNEPAETLEECINRFSILANSGNILAQFILETF